MRESGETGASCMLSLSLSVMGASYMHVQTLWTRKLRVCVICK